MTTTETAPPPQTIVLVCGHCGQPFEDRARRAGRKRRWCSGRCRDRAWRARRAAGPPAA